MASKLRTIRRTIVRRQALRGLTGSHNKGARFATAWLAARIAPQVSTKVYMGLAKRALARFGFASKTPAKAAKEG